MMIMTPHVCVPKIEEGGEWEEALIGGVGDDEDVMDGDISIDDLLAQAATESGASLTAVTSKPDIELFRVRLRTTSVISLYGCKRAPLLDLTSSLDVEAGQKGDTIKAALRLPHLDITDKYTKNALFSHIAKAEDKKVSTTHTHLAPDVADRPKHSLDASLSAYKYRNTGIQSI